MPNPFFKFKQFTVYHDRCAMKVTTDACLFGAWVANEMLPHHSAVRKLDIGTGTGLLSLMVAQKNEGLIDAIEIDNSAAQQTNENIQASPWKGNINILHTDVLQWQPEKKYDCIFSNPPFYESEIRSETTAKNIAHHNDSLRFNELFQIIKQNLAADGHFFLLLPAKRENEIDSLLKRHALCLEKRVRVRQTVNHSAFRLMLKGSHHTKSQIAEEEIVIKGENNEYMPKFADLLRDYYLYL